jgi:peroxiredoxin
MTYLVENYVLGQKCVSDQQEEKLRKRVEGFNKLAIGSPAPDFELTDLQGNIFRLSETGGKPTLLIFWSGNCPHCEAAMAEIKKLYVEFSGRVRFAGISVDEDGKIWRDAIQKNSLPWINLAELEGWNGKIIQDYYIYATPTFLVLDKYLKIIAKPAGLAELRKALAG